MCLVLGLIFVALANSIAPLLSSNAVHFMILMQNGTSITAPISFYKCMIGAVSLKDADKAMCSTSAADKAISVWSFDFQIVSHPAHLITNPVREHADAGSSAFVALNLPVKSSSANASKPLSTLSSHVKPSFLAPSKH